MVEEEEEDGDGEKRQIAFRWTERPLHTRRISRTSERDDQIKTHHGRASSYGENGCKPQLRSANKQLQMKKKRKKRKKKETSVGRLEQLEGEIKKGASWVCSVPGEPSPARLGAWGHAVRTL